MDVLLLADVFEKFIKTRGMRGDISYICKRHSLINDSNEKKDYNLLGCK